MESRHTEIEWRLRSNFRNKKHKGKVRETIRAGDWRLRSVNFTNTMMG